MIQPRRHLGAALGSRAGAFDGEGVALHLDPDAAGLEPGCYGCQPVAFLDAQFAQAVHHGAAFRKGRGHRQHRIFVDHAGRARGRNFDPMKLARPDPEIGHFLAALFAQLGERDLGPHFGEGREQAGTQRIDAHALDSDVRALGDQRRHRRERRRARIARHGNIGSAQFRLAGKRDAPPVLDLGDGDARPEMPEQVFGVVARGDGFDHRGFSRRIQTREQYRRFDLRRRHGQRIDDRQRRRCSGHGQRQTHAVAGDEARAETRQGLGHAPHRAAAQAVVAGEEGDEGMRRRCADQQPRPGAGVAEIEHAFGFAPAAGAHAVDAPCAVRAPLDARAEIAQGLRGAQHVLALEQVRDAGAADGERSQDERAVRNRFVARYAAASLERAR